MSFKDSDNRREGYLDELDIPIVKDPVLRWDSDKLLKYTDRIYNLQVWNRYRGTDMAELVRQPGPVTMGFHIHNPCNEKCPDCSGWRSKLGATASIPTKVADWIMMEGSDLGLKGIQFSGGGEPCMHPDFNHMIRFANKCGIEVGLITNGTAITELDLYELPLCTKWIRFSMDAGSREMRIKSHGVDTWDTLVKNIETIVKNATGVRPYPVMGGAFLVSDTTLPDAENFIKVCVDLGLSYAQLRPYQYLGHEWFEERHEKIIKTLVERDWPIEVVASGWRKEEDTFFRTYDYCWGSHLRTEINANSYLYPCCHLCADVRNAFGRIEKAGDFTRIWKEKNLDFVDVRKCIPYCIYHRMSTTLQRFMKETPHEEFLG